MLAACAAQPGNPAAPEAAAYALIPAGAGLQTAELPGIALQVFTYRPSGCAVSGALLVFHGHGRNASGYRDDAIPLARHFCMLVVAPLFDEGRFPAWRYALGGIVHGGEVLPADVWTVRLVPQLVTWVRRKEGRADLPYALLGHSGGGQFLSRVAAFGDGTATRIVIANPSTWVWPSLDVAAPYGLGGVYPPAQGEAALRRYLAAPATILLGQEDVGSYELATNAEAEAQGANRLERGQAVYRAAELAAHEHGWAFNWRLAFVPGVGHSAGEMFASKQAFAALQQ